MKRKGVCKNCGKEIYYGKWLESWEKERWIHKHSNNEDCMLYATPRLCSNPNCTLDHTENKYNGKRAKEKKK